MGRHLCHKLAMATAPALPITRKLVDSLYLEAMVLTDEARGYFDDIGRFQRNGLSPLDKVSFSCESLKVTTRLMHIVAWLLTWRAMASEGQSPASRRIGNAAPSDDEVIDRLPEPAQKLVRESCTLYWRVQRLASDQGSMVETPSPARHLLRQLEASF
jgi:regulator of CtrA degradation